MSTVIGVTSGTGGACTPSQLNIGKVMTVLFNSSKHKVLGKLVTLDLNMDMVVLVILLSQRRALKILTGNH